MAGKRSQRKRQVRSKRRPKTAGRRENRKPQDAVLPVTRWTRKQGDLARRRGREKQARPSRRRLRTEQCR